LRALMLDPAFLFADEPTSRLDPITQKETLDLICMTTRQLNCAMLLVSHDIEILNKSCDRVIRLS
jgi:peptide/nickel transport system ATP-binding protein